MGLVVGDVVFARAGRPALVVGQDPSSGRVYVDDSKAAVQEAARHGIKNGLVAEKKDIFHEVLDATKDPDARKEIDNLFARISEMKQAGADPRLLRYLEGELQYRVSRERYTPREIGVDPNTIGV